MNTYFVKSAWVSNLDSAHENLCLFRDELLMGDRASVEAFGRVYTMSNEDALSALIRECYRLYVAASSGKVSGRDYGRIKTIVEWRVNQRYARCLSSGMSERDAGVCFGDL